MDFTLFFSHYSLSCIFTSFGRMCWAPSALAYRKDSFFFPVCQRTLLVYGFRLQIIILIVIGNCKFDEMEDYTIGYKVPLSGSCKPIVSITIGLPLSLIVNRLSVSVFSAVSIVSANICKDIFPGNIV